MYSVNGQFSHNLSSYKKLLFYSPYSRKKFLNGKKPICKCKNSVKVQKSHYLCSYKKIHHIVEKCFQMVESQFSYVAIQ